MAVECAPVGFFISLRDSDDDRIHGSPGDARLAVSPDDGIKAVLPQQADLRCGLLDAGQISKLFVGEETGVHGSAGLP